MHHRRFNVFSAASALALGWPANAAAPSWARGDQAPLPAPRHSTNTENTRRIAVGGRFVAFATSGGMRCFTRASGEWRTLTIDNGLPSHNVFDVAFDPTEANTMWALCGARWVAPGEPAGRQTLFLV